MNDIFKGTLRCKQFVMCQETHHLVNQSQHVIYTVLLLNVDRDKNKIDIVLLSNIMHGVSESDSKKILQAIVKKISSFYQFLRELTKLLRKSLNF